MKTNKNILAAAMLAAGLLTAAGHAAAIDEMNFGLDTLISGDTPASAAKPWVNAKFLDLSFLGGSGFDGVKNTMELQITTTQGRDPVSGPAISQANLDAAGLGAYPDLAVVTGNGNLVRQEYVSKFYLNFNPAKDLSKLSLSYSGDLGFPAPGVAPVSFLTSENGFDLGSAGKFDIEISFADGALGPAGGFSTKLVFIYGGPLGSDQNLDLSDFRQGSDGKGMLAASRLGGTLPDGLSTIAAVPEPSTYAMLGVGLAALGFVARRKARG